MPRLNLVLLLAFLCLDIVISFPTNISLASPDWDISIQNGLVRRQGRKGLRIMPLGASNTAGVGSSPEDGYRRPLRDHLRAASYSPVNMVGSQRSAAGAMRNGAHEGYPGRKIFDVGREMRENGYLNRKPNIVLLHAGTNNCRDDDNVENGHEQLADIANYILDQVQGVAVIMSTLPPLTRDAAANARCRDILNPNIRQKVKDLREEGKNVRLVDIGAGVYIRSEHIGSDGVHFNNDGFGLVAELWYDTIRQLDIEGRIVEPEQTQFPDQSNDDDNQTCEKRAGNSYGPVESQFGRAGADDGVYSHSSEFEGNIKGNNDRETYVFSSKNDPENIFFAQLVNPTNDPDRNHIQDELIYWVSGRDLGEDKPQAFVRINRGDLRFDDAISFDVDDGPGCLSRGLWWGDVNNDGLDDYICIGAEGNMYVSLNKGGIPPRFENIGLYKTVPQGYTQRHVRLADIDGDGRLDYCVTSDSGDISCWRNAGVGDRPKFWQEMGVIFDGKGMGNLAGTRFVDINGDHRYDWVWVNNDNGGTRIFTNSRGRFDGGRPLWREAARAHSGEGSGDAHRRVKFARLYSSDRPAADYVHIVTETFTTDFHRHRLSVWRNLGTGGTRLKADGNRYADMTGNGRDDLLWIRSTGEVTWWENKNRNGHTSSPWTWGEPVDIFNVNRDGGNRDRRGVHFADWDGDGACDVLYHDRISGHVEWWRNAEGQGVYDYRGRIGPTCNQGIGFGVFDLGLRFADIDGDGRADWLCMEPDGRTTGFLNTAGSGGLRPLGQIKKSEGHERVNHRWADVNGDGRADFIWMDNFNGNTEVWYNDGEVDERVAGSKFKWTAKGKLYDGQSRSTNQYFPDFDGNGRADLHLINPLTNTGQTWFNICPPGGSGQDDPNMDPDLPTDPPRCSRPLCDYLDYCGLPPLIIDPDTLQPIRFDDDDGIETRAEPRRSSGRIRDIAVPAISAIFEYSSLAYPNIQYYLENTPRGIGHSLYAAQGTCSNTQITAISADSPSGGLQVPLPGEFDTRGPVPLANLDHPFDLQVMKLFLTFIVTGRYLRGGGFTRLPRFAATYVSQAWVAALPPGSGFNSVNDLVMNAFGSSNNILNFVPLQRSLNGVKAYIFGCLQPVSLDDRFPREVVAAITGGITELEKVEQRMHNFFGTFALINTPDFLTRMNNVIDDIRTNLVTLEGLVFGWRGIVDLWDEFIPDFFEHLTQTGYEWGRDAINIMIDESFRVGTSTNNGGAIRETANFFIDQLQDIFVSGRTLPRPRERPRV